MLLCCDGRATRLRAICNKKSRRRIAGGRSGSSRCVSLFPLCDGCPNGSLDFGVGDFTDARITLVFHYHQSAPLGRFDKPDAAVRERRAEQVGLQDGVDLSNHRRGCRCSLRGGWREFQAARQQGQQRWQAPAGQLAEVRAERQPVQVRLAPVRQGPEWAACARALPPPRVA